MIAFEPRNNADSGVQVQIFIHSRNIVSYQGPCKRTQQVTTLVAQQYWELLALVA